MRGRHNGLCARLTEEVPGLLSVHCVAHDLQLASMDAAKELPYVLHFDDTLKALFKYYQYSARRQRGLEAAAEDVGMDKLRKLSKLKDLRWAASEARAVDALVADYRAVVHHLEQESGVSHILPLCYNHYLLQFYCSKFYCSICWCLKLCKDIFSCTKFFEFFKLNHLC